MEIHNSNEIRVLLVGKTGSGKSSVGNQLFNSKAFEVGRYCMTKTSQLEKCTLKDGSELVIVDTPGYCNIHLTEEETQTEINRGMELLAPGPHCIIMVFSFSERLTADDIKRLENLQSVFNMYLQKHVLVVFTGMDELEDEGQTLDEYIERLPQQFKDFLNRLGTSPIGVAANLQHQGRLYPILNHKGYSQKYRDALLKEIFRVNNACLEIIENPETCRKETSKVDAKADSSVDTADSLCNRLFSWLRWN